MLLSQGSCQFATGPMLLSVYISESIVSKKNPTKNDEQIATGISEAL